jgi:bifunctional non-homologous end joining protein LigD
MPEKVVVQVEQRQLQLTNLDKVLYPQTGFTKGEVIDYYSRIAPVLLPHLVDRALTVKRYPNGVDAPHFFEKNASRGTPDWVRTVTLPVPGSTMKRDTIDFIVVEELATLVWLANLAALELHVPQWRVPAKGTKPKTDLLVFDLDPGAPASIVECCEVALLVRDLLAEDGLTLTAKTSGSKGMQVSAPVRVKDPAHTSGYAHWVAKQLESAQPKLVVSRMTKSLRPGKVFVDWSQNNAAKTTVAPYSLRARDEPTVSTPVTWDEVGTGATLRFTAAEVLERIAEFGDLFAPTLDDTQRVPITAEMAGR